MDIETKCTGCGKLLTVAAEFAGRSARCPVCNTIYVVPQPPVVEAPAANLPATDSPVAETTVGSPTPPLDSNWFMKTPEGPIYGPVQRIELLRWVRDGRVTHDCQLRPEDKSDWQAADIEFPALRPPT